MWMICYRISNVNAKSVFKQRNKETRSKWAYGVFLSFVSSLFPSKFNCEQTFDTLKSLWIKNIFIFALGGKFPMKLDEPTSFIDWALSLKYFKKCLWFWELLCAKYMQYTLMHWFDDLIQLSSVYFQWNHLNFSSWIEKKNRKLIFCDFNEHNSVEWHFWMKQIDRFTAGFCATSLNHKQIILC